MSDSAPYCLHDAPSRVYVKVNAGIHDTAHSLNGPHSAPLALARNPLATELWIYPMMHCAADAKTQVDKAKKKKAERCFLYYEIVLNCSTVSSLKLQKQVLEEREPAVCGLQLNRRPAVAS